MALSTWREALGGLLATRFSLFSIEFREELERLAYLAALAAGLVLLLCLMLTFFWLALLFQFWEYRVAICVAAGALFLLLGLIAAFLLHATLKVAGDPFSLTRGEFEKDQVLIKAAFSKQRSASEGDAE